MQKQKSWLAYCFVLLMFMLSSCGSGGGGSGGGSSNGATTVTLPVSMLTPTDKAGGVGKKPTIQLQFNETVNNVDGNISLHAGSPSGTTITISSIAAGADNMYSFSPINNLSARTTYYVVVRDGITDSTGAPIRTTTFSFTTDGIHYAYVIDHHIDIDHYFPPRPSKINKCNVENDGSLSHCYPAGAAFMSPTAIAADGKYVYITHAMKDTSSSATSRCIIADDGTLSKCIKTGNQYENISGIAFNAGYAYVATYKQNDDKDEDTFRGSVSKCSESEDGSLYDCNSTHIKGLKLPEGIAINAGHIYFTNTTSSDDLQGNVIKCDIDEKTESGLSKCASTTSGLLSPKGIAFNSNYAYITNPYKSLVSKCKVANDGSLSHCDYITSTFAMPSNIAFNAGYAYVASPVKNEVSKCNVGSDGDLTGCSSTGNNFTLPLAIAFGAAWDN